ncbi:MAG: SDR family NAD(P)-dependent oxidoreductase [Betaproteobacteria bacterium]|nr:SDR family NAD(P)-dependent oxidoreductase [Betaproteobacteria bacterium]
MDDLRQGVVLITGGSRGIGLACAEAFLRGGARVAISAREKHALGKAEERLAALGEVAIVESDVGRRAAAERGVEQVLRRFERIDVLVNNAGQVWVGYFANQPWDRIDTLVETNVKGVLYMTRAALPYMLAQGSGAIINIASGAGKSGFPGFAVYCATKFAVVGFTASLAAEVGGKGVRVHSVCPGAVATDMQAEIGGRRGMPPERVATQVVNLSGPHPPIAAGECLEIYS